MHTRGVRTLALVLVLAGCETGTEIAAVAQAKATRQGDHVVVTANLDCMLAKGMHRGDGNCDADGTRVCLHTRWYAVSPSASATPVAQNESCETIAHIRGATMRLEATHLPDNARIVVVSTSDQVRSRDEAQRQGVVVTPN